MTPTDIELIAEIVRARSGLVVTPDKAYLLESRLSPLARKEGFASIEALTANLRQRRDERLAWAVAEAMTTNETFFFRDRAPFECLREDILLELARARPPDAPLRVWCAACSTGQEPYSLAMIIDELSAKLAGRRVEILATDISSKALAKAKAGVYSQFEVQRGLPVAQLVKYFAKIDEAWRIDPALARFINFRRFNLLDDFQGLGRFDIVFCRNVLIYFDQPTKARVLERMAAAMQPDGFLLLGGAETLVGASDGYEAVRGKRGLYRPAGGAAAAGKVA